MNRRRNCSTAASLDGRAESKNPLTTTEVNIVFLFGQRGQENERQVTPTILSLRKFHQGVEYFELSRSRLESLPTTLVGSETGQQSAPHIQPELNSDLKFDIPLFSIPPDSRILLTSLLREDTIFHVLEMNKKRIVLIKEKLRCWFFVRFDWFIIEA